MKTYGLKFIDFLANYNVVVLNSYMDLIKLRVLCSNIKLSVFGKEKWEDLIADIDRYDRQHNRTYETEPLVYVEYRNDKGFGIYKETREKLIDWFGIEPFSVDELVHEG